MITKTKHTITGYSIEWKAKSGRGKFDFPNNKLFITNKQTKHLTKLEMKAFQFILEHGGKVKRDDIQEYMYPEIHSGMIINTRPLDQIMHKLVVKFDGFLITNGRTDTKTYELKEYTPHKRIL